MVYGSDPSVDMDFSQTQLAIQVSANQQLRMEVLDSRINDLVG
jgi:hypothetical protein